MRELRTMAQGPGQQSFYVTETGADGKRRVAQTGLGVLFSNDRGWVADLPGILAPATYRTRDDAVHAATLAWINKAEQI